MVSLILYQQFYHIDLKELQLIQTIFFFKTNRIYSCESNFRNIIPFELQSPVDQASAFWCFPWVEHCSSWPPDPKHMKQKNWIKICQQDQDPPEHKASEACHMAGGRRFFKSVESLLGQDRDEVLTGSQPAMVRVLMIYNSQWCYLTKRDILDPCWLSLTESGYLWTYLQYF